MTGQPNVRFLMSDRHSPRITGPRITGPRITGPRITGPRITGPRITGCYGDPVVMPGDCLPRILATEEKT